MNFVVGFRHLSKMSRFTPQLTLDERNISQTLIKDLFAEYTHWFITQNLIQIITIDSCSNYTFTKITNRNLFLFNISPIKHKHQLLSTIFGQ